MDLPESACVDLVGVELAADHDVLADDLVGPHARRPPRIPADEQGGVRPGRGKRLDSLPRLPPGTPAAEEVELADLLDGQRKARHPHELVARIPVHRRPAVLAHDEFDPGASGPAGGLGVAGKGGDPRRKALLGEMLLKVAAADSAEGRCKDVALPLRLIVEGDVPEIGPADAERPGLRPRQVDPVLGGVRQDLHDVAADERRALPRHLNSHALARKAEAGEDDPAVLRPADGGPAVGDVGQIYVERCHSSSSVGWKR